MKTYTTKDIALECNVTEASIIAFLKYRRESNLPIPSTIAYSKPKYNYTKKDANLIIKLFKSKKRGEMAKYNYKYNWGSAYREKHQKHSK